MSSETARPGRAVRSERNLGPGDGEIPRRPLGKTGEKVSILGVGGHHLGDFATLDEAARLVHEAIDAGVTFLDNAWE